MNVKQLIDNLKSFEKEYGSDIEVMFIDDNNDAWSINSVTHKVAEHNEYPEDWDMPEGYSFIQLRF